MNAEKFGSSTEAKAVDPEAEKRSQLAEQVRELSSSQESALAEYYEGNPDTALHRQIEISDLLEQSLEGDYPSSVYVALQDSDGKISLRHPDEITEPGHCHPNMVSRLSDRVTFTDAYGRTRTLRTESSEEAEKKAQELEQRGFARGEIGDRRNQVLLKSGVQRGALVRIDTDEQSGNYIEPKDTIYQAQDYPVIDQLGQVHFGIKDKDGFARNWDNPDASWNENAG